VMMLSLAAQGLSNRDISERVKVSESTVKAHLRCVMRKLGATQRAEAVAAGIRKGLI
jgi:DNA-binding NarL/FixJ family response regulator